MTIVLYVALGLCVGSVSGLLGIGGGVLLLPLLMWLFDLNQRQAAGITLAILVVPVVLPAVWQYYLQGVLAAREIGIAAWIACGFAAGTLLGAHLSTLVDVVALRFWFGLFLAYVAARFLLASDSHVASAAFGLLGTGVAWIGYTGLRALGRKHLARPDLGEHIRRMEEQGRGEVDYYI